MPFNYSKIYKTTLICLFLGLFFTESYGQLGFCNGNSGDPIFREDFGQGTTFTTIPNGTTSYTFVNDFPHDGFYTVTDGTLGTTLDWHQLTDHTPGDTNGRCLIVNADFTAGEFFRIPVSGLCENTTYEFSAWLVNVVIGNYCNSQGISTIPINVRFEIWDGTDTNLMASGDTGDIFESSNPQWEEYALVFQTGSGQDSVILKMLNNGVGGCGNDLAIDDIEFKSCGDSVVVLDENNNNASTICSGQTPYNLTLNAIPDSSVFNSHFYQWQESTDGVTWNDISGETNDMITVSVSSSMFYRVAMAEFASSLTNPLCVVYSNSYYIGVNQAPAQPALECWESAMLNNTTCQWEVTGTQPTAPTGLECWETASFNNTSCAWEVSGTQPTAPTGLECWETTTFNNVTCLWEVSGTQPPTPTGLECWETATFNNVTCLWEVSGTQPAQPTIECWESANFNDTTCTWEVTGTQPPAPTGLECWETTTFNNVTCLWEVSGTQPTQPTIACWEMATFNNTTCLWEVSGTQPMEPATSDCWEVTTFNDTTCAWEIIGSQPPQPTNLECWETTAFNDVTCQWDITGTQPPQPTGLECWETASFNNTTCLWEVSGTQPPQPTNLECWETTVFNNTSCQWEINGIQPPQPTNLECWEMTNFDNTSCSWEITGTQPPAPTGLDCGETAAFNTTTCQWEITVISTNIVFSVRSDYKDIIITIANEENYEYSLDGITYQSDPIFYDVPIGLYTIHVRDIACNNIATIEHIHFYAPRFLTPNGDFYYDTFDLSDIVNFNNYEVTIFDRFGKVLKREVNNGPFHWDGMYNNALMPSTDYWYLVIVDGYTFRGHFALTY